MGLVPLHQRHRIHRLLPIARQYAASGATLFFGVVSQFGLFVILARAFGAEQFGQYVVILAVTALATSFCGIGAGDVMVRRLARNPDDYGAMLGHSLLLLAGSGIALVLISAGVLTWAVQVSDDVWTNFLVMLAFSLAAMLGVAYVGFVERVFIGFQAFGLANAVNAGFSVIRLLAGLVACQLFGVTTLAPWAVWNLVAHVLMCLCGAAMIWARGRPVWRIDRTEFWLGFQFSTPNFFDALRQNVDRMTLSLVVPAAVLGSYGSAIRLVQTSQVVVSSLNRIIYPRFAKRIHGGIANVMGLITLYACGVTLLAAFTALFLFFAAPYLPLLIGADFQPAVSNVRILCWLLLLLAAQTVPYDLLGAFDHHRVRARVYNTASLAGAALTVAAVYQFKITGAYVAVYVTGAVTTYVLWHTLFRVARRESGLERIRAVAVEMATEEGPREHADRK